MRRPIVVGNWKMNGRRASVDHLIAGLRAVGGVDVAVCPPAIFIRQVVEGLGGKGIGVGAQDVSLYEQDGAYTGEVSASMLSDAGCSYVIVGHSERRALCGETDEDVARKFANALRAGLCPILCVGETLEEREQGVTESVVARQLDAVLGVSGVAAFERALIAYEPVWAIGTGRTATPEQAQQVHAFIRARLAAHDAGVASRARIQYGGSMKPENAAELMAMPDIDGGLIGGASLKAEDFMAICAAAGGAA
ncbi:triose-phosphate isomerase [Thiofaba sp. EF100]|uniref:triose-phosphate isomerase n=1 Tax=Thiofaba sp. EF100 TaxID=3121274 RepID=UPI003221E967